MMISFDQDRKFVAMRLVKNDEDKLVVITITFRDELDFIGVVSLLNGRFDPLFTIKKEMDI